MSKNLRPSLASLNGGTLFGQTKVGSIKSTGDVSGVITNAWSDAAREASAEARRGRILKDDDSDIAPRAGEEKHSNYIAMYKGKQVGVKAPSLYDAQKTAADHFGAKKSWQVNTMIHSHADGVPIKHVADF